MSAHERDAVLLRALLAKHGIGEPAPPGLPAYILDSKERVFRRVLRSAGGYGTFYSALSAIHFILRRNRVPLWAVRAAAAAGAAALIAAGIYFSSVRGTVRQGVPAAPPPAESQMLKGSEVMHRGVTGNQQELLRTLCIAPFEGHGVESGVLAQAAYAFEKEMSGKMGEDYAAVQTGGKKVRARYSLTGSIERVGDRYLLFVKLVDMQTTGLLFHGRENMESLADIDAACVRLAQKMPVPVK
jgi:hypothetical protein